MTQVTINPKSIKSGVVKAASGSSKAVFPEVMHDISAMGPAMMELGHQATGGSNTAGAVLNAAFSGIQVAGGMQAMNYGGIGGYGAYSAGVPGMMGVGGHSTATGFAKGASPYGVTSVGTGVDDPAQYQQELMTTMNSNNLKLLELQAMMQSNMQSWTTKSNILSADHRARMSMIEKFTARG